MLVLITGVGNVGKSHFRRLLYKRLVRELKATSRRVEQYDVDRFASLRHEDDQDLLIYFSVNQVDKDTITLIEDVHGPCANSILPIENYHHVFYVTTDPLTHLHFWIARAKIWFKKGRFDWDGERGAFRGTGKPYDLRNLPGIVTCVTHQLQQRTQIQKDIDTLTRARVYLHIVRATATKNGPVFTPIPLDFLTECHFS